MALLKLKGVTTGYGQVQILWGLDLDVAAGETALLLGANGVGKTTTLRAIIGLLPCWHGEIIFDGEPLQDLGPSERIRRGIGYMSQIGVFPDLSILENMRLGGYFLSNAEVQRRCERLFTMFPDLAERRNGIAASLSGGQRKMLGIAKVLISQPKLLLMDEPSAGLAPVFVRQVIETLKSAVIGGTTLLIAEQNVAFLEFADRGFLIDSGRVRLAGARAELIESDAVKSVYFGLEPGSHKRAAL
jgi:branched-chain amino acid transport system ATP-binding protein